jgi:hypothetical protein
MNESCSCIYSSSSEISQTSPLKKKKVVKSKTPLCVGYTMATVLTTWDSTTEYGISFRNLTHEEQQAEVKRLNTMALKGQKDIVKHKLLQVKYKSMIEEKMRVYLSESRSPLNAVYHCAPVLQASHVMSPSFLSVGEWVEVDGDITPGWNSEGGIAVIINVQDSLADVKYVLTKW